MDNKCLSAGATQIEVDDCDAGDATQVWSFSSPGPSPLMHGGRCLQPVQPVDGAMLVLADCDPSQPLQQWSSPIQAQLTLEATPYVSRR